MIIRTDWMSDDSFGDNDDLLNDAIYRFKVQKSSLEGRNGIVDGVEEIFVVQNHTNTMNSSKYDKKVSFDIDSNVHTGSLLEFDDKKWLVASKIVDKQAYKVGSVIECNNTLTLHYKSGISWVSAEVPIVIENGVRLYSQGQEDNKYISTLKDEIIVYVADNEVNANIKVDDVYKIGKRNYKVISVQDVLINGLLVLKMEVTTDIPVVEEHTSNIIILNGEEVTLYAGEASTLQLNVQCKLDGIIVDNPNITYASSDIACATVNSSGLVTITGTGSTTITAYYGNSNDTIIITSLMSVADNFEIVIVPSDTEMYINKTKTFTASVTNNGVDMPYHGVTWSLVNVDGTNNQYCTYSVDDRDITITSLNNINKFIKIKATLSNDNTIFKEQTIKFKSLI